MPPAAQLRLPLPAPQPGAEGGDSHARPALRAARAAGPAARGGPRRGAAPAAARAAPSGCSAGWWPRSSRATRGSPGSGATWWASRRPTGRGTELADGHLLRGRPGDHRRVAGLLEGHRDRRGARRGACGWRSASPPWSTRAGPIPPVVTELTGIDDEHGRRAAPTSTTALARLRRVRRARTCWWPTTRRSTCASSTTSAGAWPAATSPSPGSTRSCSPAGCSNGRVGAPRPGTLAAWADTTVRPIHRALPDAEATAEVLVRAASGCSPSAGIDTLERAVAFAGIGGARHAYKLALAEDLPAHAGRLPDARPRRRRPLRGQGGQPAPPGALLLRPRRPPRPAHRPRARGAGVDRPRDLRVGVRRPPAREPPDQGAAPAVQPARHRRRPGSSSSSTLAARGAAPLRRAAPAPGRRRLLRPGALAAHARGTPSPASAPSTRCDDPDPGIAARRRPLRRGPVGGARRARPSWARGSAAAVAAGAVAVDRGRAHRRPAGGARRAGRPRRARAARRAGSAVLVEPRRASAGREVFFVAGGVVRHRPRVDAPRLGGRRAGGPRGAAPARALAAARRGRSRRTPSTRPRSSRTACASAARQRRGARARGRAGAPPTRWRGSGAAVRSLAVGRRPSRPRRRTRRESCARRPPSR